MSGMMEIIQNQTPKNQENLDKIPPANFPELSDNDAYKIGSILLALSNVILVIINLILAMKVAGVF